MDNRRLEKILIIKPSSLGDIIHALPVAASIKASLPDAAIDWVVGKGYEEILEGSPAIRRIITFDRGMFSGRGRAKGKQGDTGNRRQCPLVICRPIEELGKFLSELRRERYDAVIDLQGLLRSALMAKVSRSPRRIGFENAREGAPWFYGEKVAVPGSVTHAVDRYMLVLGRLGIETTGVPEFGISLEEKDYDQAEGLLAELGISPGEPFVAIAPSARWVTKRWPAENFVRLADMLVREKGIRCVFVGSKSDAGLLDGYEGDAAVKCGSLFGRTSLKGLAALLKRARLLVTNDSGPMHIAAAVGTRVVALFGPTDPGRTGPYGVNHYVMTSGASCSPCFKRDCDTIRCLTDISVESAFGVIAKILEG